MNNKQKNYYLSKFMNKIFVLKIGGEVINSKTILTGILKDIKELIDLGIKIVLVHGGGPQADILSKQLGCTPTKIDGRRITGKSELEVVKMLYGGSLNLEILSIMKKLGMSGIRVSGLDGNALDVKMRDKKNIDYGFVGDIEKVNPQIFFDLLKMKYIPVVSPLAADSDGTILNINADTIATEVAIAMQAEKLILFTNTDGIFNGKKLLSTVTGKEGQEILQKQIVTDGMAVKLQNCLKAVQNGIARVHILNGLSKHSLLVETLTKEGIGTMITKGQEKEIYLTE